MHVIAYLAVLAAFLIIDLVWIGLYVLDYYQATIGPMMREQPALLWAAGFYLLYAAGIVRLAVQPALQTGSARPALINGAILGALAYGTYTVTNYSILNGWTVGLVISDTLWGAALTATTAALGYLAAARLARSRAR